MMFKLTISAINERGSEIPLSPRLKSKGRIFEAEEYSTREYLLALEKTMKELLSVEQTSYVDRMLEPLD